MMAFNELLLIYLCHSIQSTERDSKTRLPSLRHSDDSHNFHFHLYSSIQTLYFLFRFFFPSIIIKNNLWKTSAICVVALNLIYVSLWMKKKILSFCAQRNRLLLYSTRFIIIFFFLFFFSLIKRRKERKKVFEWQMVNLLNVLLQSIVSIDQDKSVAREKPCFKQLTVLHWSKL